MLMRMFEFILTLLVVGGIGLLVTIWDPQNAQVAPYIGFTALFAGLGAFSLSLLFTLIGFQLPNPETVAGVGFFWGYILGMLGGAALGFMLARRRHWRIKSAPHE